MGNIAVSDDENAPLRGRKTGGDSRSTPLERGAPLDSMIEFAMEALLSGKDTRKSNLVMDMAHQWPGEPALALVYAVTSATQAIEETFGAGGADDPVVPLGYRLSALISADVHAVQSMGQVPSVAEDLLHFWRRVDPKFLRLT
jgi:hypothetical protein